MIKRVLRNINFTTSQSEGHTNVTKDQNLTDANQNQRNLQLLHHVFDLVPINAGTISALNHNETPQECSAFI